MDGQLAADATVLILYAHPLLGMGLEQLLAGEPELAVTALDTHPADPEAARHAAHEALGRHPDVVILERGSGIAAEDVLLEAPEALLIDVGVDAGESFAVVREPLDGRADGILDAIRRFRQLRPGSGPAIGLLVSLLR